jgi:hypothetical protein
MRLGGIEVYAVTGAEQVILRLIVYPEHAFKNVDQF